MTILEKQTIKTATDIISNASATLEGNKSKAINETAENLKQAAGLLNELVACDVNTPIQKAYTLKEAAEELGITYRTIQRYLETGQLKATKVCGKWRVTPEALKELTGN